MANGFDASGIIAAFINAGTGLMEIHVQGQPWGNGTFEGRPPPDHGMLPIGLILPIAVLVVLIIAIALFWWSRIRKKKNKGAQK